ncbi:hypothetical protein G6M26_30855 [Agrobacterium tumefaciens]|nr:hypothetical protein [Agrobacterium tumefaciens]NTE22952.1 hypothetical protein [Agrobacterium tumefaciens]
MAILDFNAFTPSEWTSNQNPFFEATYNPQKPLVKSVLSSLLEINSDNIQNTSINFTSHLNIPTPAITQI